MRNLSDKCKTCNDNHFGMAMCFDICGVPIDILDEIERKRNDEQKANVSRETYERRNK